MQYSTHIKKLFLCSSFAIASPLTLADADISVQLPGNAAQATANVDISVEVPEILTFGIGATGTAIADLVWTVDNASGVGIGNDQNYTGAAAPFVAPDPYANTATASIAANGGTGSSAAGNQVSLPVFLFSNNGSAVTITTTVSGGATGGGTADALDHQTLANTIPIADFSSGDGGNILHPTLASTQTADTPVDGSGIVNASDVWTYTYTPSSTPAAGVYEARITYVAAQP